MPEDSTPPPPPLDDPPRPDSDVMWGRVADMAGDIAGLKTRLNGLEDGLITLSGQLQGTTTRAERLEDAVHQLHGVQGKLLVGQTAVQTTLSEQNTVLSTIIDRLDVMAPTIAGAVVLIEDSKKTAERTAWLQQQNTAQQKKTDERNKRLQAGLATVATGVALVVGVPHAAWWFIWTLTTQHVAVSLVVVVVGATTAGLMTGWPPFLMQRRGGP